MVSKFTILWVENNMRRSNTMLGCMLSDEMKLAFNAVEALKYFLWFSSGDTPAFGVLFCQIILS